MNYIRIRAFTQIDPQKPHCVGENKFEKPFKELFLWAILNDRMQLAKLFWEYCENPIITAIVATKIYDSLAAHLSVHDPEKPENYLERKR